MGGVHRGSRLRLAFALAALGLLLLSSTVRGASPTVVLLPTTGIVDDGMAKYLIGGLNEAESVPRRSSSSSTRRVAASPRRRTSSRPSSPRRFP